MCGKLAILQKLIARALMEKFNCNWYIMSKESISVLLVEDDPSACRLMEHALSGNGSDVEYDLQTADDLAAATEALRSRRFDNVILDLDLSDSTGIDTVRSIRKTNPAVSIIVLTNLDDKETSRQALEVGADYYFVKGKYPREKLVQLVCSCIERRRRERRVSERREGKQSHAEREKQVEVLMHQLWETEKRLSEEGDEHQDVVSLFRNLRKDFLTIFDSLPAMIWYRDKEGTILRVNRCAADSVGLSPKEVVGKNYYELFPEGSKQAHEKDLAVILSGTPVFGELREFKGPSGEKRWAIADRIPYSDKDGNIAGVIIFAQDITERKLAEEALNTAKAEIDEVNRQLEASIGRANLFAKEAKAADEAKGVFLANMSHEIRTPLNAIIGLSDILAEEELNAEQHKYVGVIQKSAENFLDLINDILDFSKIEAGKLDIEMEACGLKRLLAEIEELMDVTASKKQLDFEVRCEEDMPTQIQTDPTRLRQCLVNLVSNAIKFTEKGHVYMNVTMIRSTEEGDEDYIRFDIEDTGIGISAEKLELIFKSFCQAENNTTRKFGGTGLGLAITKKLTELLGGRIEVKSEPGNGSVFSIILPVEAESRTISAVNNCDVQSEESGEVETAKEQLPGRILLVEDDLSSQLFMNLLFNGIGLDVTVASDGSEAMEKSLSEDFDVIVMDMQMSAVNGYDTVGKLRSNGLKTPIVAVTAEMGHEERDKCIAAGCDECVSKPIRRNQLYEVIGKYLAKQENSSGQNESMCAGQSE
jgi:PAS domain S-box-containing protein